MKYKKAPSYSTFQIALAKRTLKRLRTFFIRFKLLNLPNGQSTRLETYT